MLWLDISVFLYAKLIQWEILLYTRLPLLQGLKLLVASCLLHQQHHSLHHQHHLNPKKMMVMINNDYWAVSFISSIILFIINIISTLRKWWLTWLLSCFFFMILFTMNIIFNPDPEEWLWSTEETLKELWHVISFFLLLKAHLVFR